MRRSSRWTPALVLLLLLLAPAPYIVASSSPAPGDRMEPEAAKTLVDAALAKAKADHKNVFVYFSASWCGWCHRMQTFLASPDAGKLMHDNFVIVQLVALESGDNVALENPGAREMLTEMSEGASTGIPFYFVLDEGGKKIADSLIMPGPKNVGHPALPEEVTAFVKQLETIAPRLTAEQRQQIGAHLTKMAAG